MLLRKDIEAIFAMPELWRSLHDLEELYHFRRASAENAMQYKTAFQAFWARVETSK